MSTERPETHDQTRFEPFFRDEGEGAILGHKLLLFRASVLPTQSQAQKRMNIYLVLLLSLNGNSLYCIDRTDALIFPGYKYRL